MTSSLIRFLWNVYTSRPRVYLSDISIWSNIRELRYTVGKLTENYEEKMDIVSPKVTNFNRGWANAVSNHLAKTASKSVYLFGWNVVHSQSRKDRQTDTHTHTQTNYSGNITPPRFRGGVKCIMRHCDLDFHPNFTNFNRFSQCGTQSLSENCVHIDASVRLEFCSVTETDSHTDTLQRKYHPSPLSSRNNKYNIQQPIFTFTHWPTRFYLQTQDSMLNAFSWICTPPRNRGGVIFSLQFVCVSVCLWVCPALLLNKIPAKRMNRFGREFSLNGCLPHWLEPYWNWWTWVKGQGPSDVIPIFSS